MGQALAKANSSPSAPTPIVLSEEDYFALLDSRAVNRDHIILMRMPGGLYVAHADDGEAIAWSGLACQCHVLRREDGVPVAFGAVLHDETVIAALEILTALGFRIALVGRDDSGRFGAFQFIEPARPRITAAIGEVGAAMGRLPAQLRGFACECIVSWLEKFSEASPWNGHQSPGSNATEAQPLPDLDIVTDLGRALAGIAPLFQRQICRQLLDIVRKHSAMLRDENPSRAGRTFDPVREWTPEDNNGDYL